MQASGEPPDQLPAWVRERLAWLEANVGDHRRHARRPVMTLHNRPDLALAEEDLEVRHVQMRSDLIRWAGSHASGPLPVVINIAPLNPGWRTPHQLPQSRRRQPRV